MNDLPGNLTGSNPLVPWLNRLKAAVMRRTLLPGNGYKLRETSGGTILEVFTSGAGDSGARAYRVKSANGDYLVCRTWDGTSEGTTDVKVAKNFESRQIASETLDSVAHTYSYTGAATVLNRYRTASFSGMTETQQVTPLWKVDGIISVVPINYSGVTADGADLKLIEYSPRSWARA